MLVVCAGCSSPPTVPTPTPSADAVAIGQIVADTMESAHLRSVIIRVTKGDNEILTEAYGESITGVPADVTMHFRNGAVAISYVSTLLLILVDEGTVKLDDRLSTWLPDVPHSDEVTLRQLAQMTSGYPDYVLGNDAFADALYDDPFRHWTTDQLLAFALDKPLLYPPGTNWSYAHTNYVLLGLALEKATGQAMPALMSRYVLDPLELTNTAQSETAEIAEPVLHAFTSERRQHLEIPTTTPFYEESTYWNPSWTITHGAVQYTNIVDLATSARAIGSGELLSEPSYAEFRSTDLRGRTHPQPGCATCAEMTEHYTYGLGIVISGEWLLQNPLFGGAAAVMAYLPADDIAIAVAVTYAPAAFDDDGNYTNEADTLFRRIGAHLAPEHAPPTARQ